MSSLYIMCLRHVVCISIYIGAEGIDIRGIGITHHHYDNSQTAIITSSSSSPIVGESVIRRLR